MSSKAAARAQSRPPKRLSAASLARGVQLLSEIDPDLARIPRTHGAPQMWEREPGFPTLVLTILEQQVSLASARAAFERLLAAAAPLTPRTLLAFDDAALKGFGFSRQKISYSRLAAHAVESGELDFDALAALDDDAARAALTRLKGVGPWTAEIYLLRALGRPDAWPAGDLALQLAAQEVKRLRARPTAAELESLAEPWRPWRAVAARMLWQALSSPPEARDADGVEEQSGARDDSRNFKIESATTVETLMRRTTFQQRFRRRPN